MEDGKGELAVGLAELEGHAHELYRLQLPAKLANRCGAVLVV
jgi:hypothetical protein